MPIFNIKLIFPCWLCNLLILNIRTWSPLFSLIRTSIVSMLPEEAGMKLAMLGWWNGDDGKNWNLEQTRDIMQYVLYSLHYLVHTYCKINCHEHSKKIEFGFTKLLFLWVLLFTYTHPERNNFIGGLNVQ